MMTTRFVTSLCIILLIVISISAQESQKYSKNGLSFEYSPGWILSESTKGEADEIAISNKEADAQITLMAIRKLIDGKDPVAEAKKRVVDPWLNELILRYSSIAGLALKRTDIKYEVAGQTVDGVELAFEFDGQGGKLQACWVLFEKRLLLIYMIRPDRLAQKADPGWDLARRTIHIDPVVKK